MTDAWIRDYEGGVVQEVEMECLRCGCKWLADTYTEYGTVWLVSDDDACCKDCGAEDDG